MPRRPPSIITGIPRFLIGPVAGPGAAKAVEALVRIVIKEVKGHLFSISVHTRAMCRRVFPYRHRLPHAATISCLPHSDAGVMWP